MSKLAQRLLLLSGQNRQVGLCRFCYRTRPSSSHSSTSCGNNASGVEHSDCHRNNFRKQNILDAGDHRSYDNSKANVRGKETPNAQQTAGKRYLYQVSTSSKFDLAGKSPPGQRTKTYNSASGCAVKPSSGPVGRKQCQNIHSTSVNQNVTDRKPRQCKRTISTSRREANRDDGNEKVSICSEEIKPFEAIPGPKCLPVVGGILNYLPGGEFHGMSLADVVVQLHHKYGTVVRETIGPQFNIIRLYEARDIETVFRSGGKMPERLLGLDMLVQFNKERNYVPGISTCKNKEEWYRLRSQIHKKMLKPATAESYFTKHESVADCFVNHIRRIRNKNGDVENMLPEIYKYTSEAIGVVCFNKRIGAFSEQTDSEAEYLDAVVTFFTITMESLKTLPLYKLYKTKQYIKFCEAMSFLRRLSEKYTNETLQRIRDESGDTEDEDDLISYALTRTELTIEDVHTFITELIIGAVDTTGTALCFLLYQLARNPDVQNKLTAEVDTMFPDGAPLNVEGVRKMTYLKAALKEALRTLPVGGGNSRTLTRDVVCSGFRIPKGTEILMHTDVISRDGEDFKNGHQYCPERWIRGHPMHHTAHPFTYLPFGYGARMCLGKYFAEQEIFLATVKILQQFKLEYHCEPLKLEYGVLYTPTTPVNIRFVDR